MASADIQISTLRRKRGNIIGQITTLTRVLDNSQDPDHCDKLLITEHLNGLVKSWNRFDDIQFDIETLDSSEETRRSEIQCDYYAVVARAKRILQHDESLNTTRNNLTESPASIISAPIAVKLPEMRLPTFDGTIENWSSFYDLFSSTIDRNENLTSVQKLQYLRSTLTGKAAACIKSLTTTDVNYPAAIEILKEKFDCPRKTLLRHCDAIREIPKLAKDTPEAIDDLLDTLNQHLRALNNLGEPVATWNTLLISTILSKLNSDTILQWELTLPDKQMPSYTHLIKFLRKRANCSIVVNGTNLISRAPHPSVNTSPKSIHANYSKTQTFFTAKAAQCPICNGSHMVRDCEVFNSASPTTRLENATKNSLCHNCLRPGHTTNICRSIFTCRICNQRHHTLIHQPNHTVNQKPSTSATTTTHTAISTTAPQEEITEPDQPLCNRTHKPVTCRALIDTCSTTNFMTQDLAKKLSLPLKHCSIPVGALDTLTTVAKHIVKATIRSRIKNYQRTLTFLVVPNIATAIPGDTIDRATLNIPRNIELADPTFHRPAPIDMLLGAGTALSILSVGQINLSQPDDPDLYLQKTMLGWVIGGSAPTFKPIRSASCHTHTSLQFDLTRFWEIEDGPQIPHFSEAETACEEYFKNTITRNAEGRYVVSLPFNNDKPKLGESKSAAYKRFLSLERKLKRDPELNHQYEAIFKEYLDLGHMSEIPDTNEGYYLAHHGVLKMSSQTTKLRIVFDGSAASSTGLSLNDVLHTGPKIQDDLLYILLRFRTYQYVVTGDIEKMYRQFLIRPEDRKFQQVLWRDHNDSIKTFQLNTVTFGLSAAPYLAIRCLTQLADDEHHRFPQASKVLKQDFYVDDLITGTPTIQEAISLRKELTSLLNTAGLHIRQWASNDKRLLEDLPDENINQQLHLGESSIVKTLGIVWNSADDSITYTVRPILHTPRATKRFISSEIAKIYDPLGLLGPVIITAKLILQELWTLRIDWDESLPMAIHNKWSQYYSQLPLLNQARFRRKTVIQSASNIELHGFCDASERAYGACVYIRSQNNHGETIVELLVAKSRVAPLKSKSIPRLELCGSVLLASLMTTVKKALGLQIERTVYWTDSTIVLHWLRSSPHTLKTFVANRVSEIQSTTTITDWRHVSSTDNPADLLSRGQTIKDFLQSSVWQNGPSWLQQEHSHWPTWESVPHTNDPERKIAICMATIPVTKDAKILERYSSWTKLVRVIALCRRWRPGRITKGSLTVSELSQSRVTILRMLQEMYFKTEILALRRQSDPYLHGKLAKLNPLLDQDGLLRVGGRLKNSTLTYSQKHPILLPKSHITTCIIMNEHKNLLHAGAQTTLYSLRRTYWPIDGRSLVWRTIHGCVRCRRASPPSVEYIMGNLPIARVTESRPFTNVGIDYCGPFFIKEKQHRNRGRVKVYVAVFVCLAIKAIHLELVSDLTSEAFIAALRRFIARRGFCVNLYSDNGTNFKGANNELRELRELLRSDDHLKKINTFLIERAINWHFIPPQAPHFGGLWEAAVKSFKYHLKRVVGSELLTFEGLNTLIIDVEAILNSRPLTPLSSDPSDLLALTPGHFLIGDALTSLRDRDLQGTTANRLSAWQRVQQLKQHFWKRWHREYLNELANRNKWTRGQHPIIEGAIVLLREDNVPSMQWPLGRIIKTHPGSDGIVRVVTVRTASNVFDRSVKKLVPLLCQSEEQPRKNNLTMRGHEICE
ncbi:uncharacterized protein LOC143260026 [Megalopta genalis]|uniref:uncharacterized protein LOC143260026 n=1 Tax=Megalopta genalis TaxID=115081 RepID=UPI003FD2629C